MPRKTPVQCIWTLYSKDLKNCVVYQSRTLGKQTTDIAIDLDIPLRVVQHTLKTWKDTGDVVVARAWDGHLPVIVGASLDFLLVLVE
ncbi:hypothetical protein BDN71DRAFT_1503495 [Pleurotus eryngii]|uniref:Uncharacterized protein n=1 Tax=Pleurotus eryngii TaxID=5323 RepID=A0A9P6A3V1_PLEER|nr:hypothetical protein BDN71DRAFT_1503495 [Pleurotus eryngii]